MTYAYLASPYTPHGVTCPYEASKIRDQRFQAACRGAAALMQEGVTVFAPIAHSHPIERYFTEEEGLEFWMKQDIPMLDSADRLIVLTIPGWKESPGVKREIEHAVRLGLPIDYMEPV